MQKDSVPTKVLRGYLKSFSTCQSQAAEIGQALKDGKIVAMVQKNLLDCKAEFETHCKNVQLTLGVLKSDSLESRILWKLYIYDQPMREVAQQLGYSYGHCANVEMAAIKRLCRNEIVKGILKQKEGKS